MVEGAGAVRRLRLAERGPCQDELPPGVSSISVPTPYPVGPVTVYLLHGDPLTLVDTGPATPAAWQALVSGLAAHGCAPTDLRRVLLTHGHHDHFGNAWRLAALGAEVHAHPRDGAQLRLERQYVRRWRQLGRHGLSMPRRTAVLVGLRLLDLTTKPLAGFTPLGDGQLLTQGTRIIRVHLTPGHSPGHVAFELVGDDVLISGDTLLDGITPNAVVDFDPDRPDRPFASLTAYTKSLARIAGLAPRLLLPSHGPCLVAPSAEIERVLARQAERAAQVRGALGHGPASVGQVMALLFPRVRLLDSFLAYSEVLGHLLELERRGEVARVSGPGRVRWRLG